MGTFITSVSLSFSQNGSKWSVSSTGFHRNNIEYFSIIWGKILINHQIECTAFNLGKPVQTGFYFSGVNAYKQKLCKAFWKNAGKWNLPGSYETTYSSLFNSRTFEYQFDLIRNSLCKLCQVHLNRLHPHLVLRDIIES